MKLYSCRGRDIELTPYQEYWFTQFRNEECRGVNLQAIQQVLSYMKAIDRGEVCTYNPVKKTKIPLVRQRVYQEQMKELLLDNLAYTPVVVSDTCQTTLQVGTLKEEEKENKETTMYIDYDDLNGEQNYLLSRLSNVRMNLENKAYKHFGLNDDESPMTVKELVERIQAGKFVFNTKEPEKKHVYTWQTFIDWRDPAREKNEDGYRAWEKLFDEAYTKAKDTIVIKDQDEGLKAVYDLEQFPIN